MASGLLIAIPAEQPEKRADDAEDDDRAEQVVRGHSAHHASAISAYTDAMMITA